ncbi:phosphonate ABC transporter ATP-binding protein [Algisphaera agarilytica]|uniref:Phosphonate transport system ATP-binding protein n=1 Tax=Algisphaera agarilytica TaxID=1385975 RepID=A0A7X0HBK1_9BACT|nr:phosphonate ABC transporter ATP-binding protein [Algisphaera agarilytica]MBB6431365.1 phosphonate transport system ATP-binding protein [Algisphaera agarilytica]
MLELRAIDKVYESRQGRVTAVEGVSLKLEKGEFCVLLGPSGAGKSTVLRVINGMTQATNGEVSFDGELVTRRNRRSIQNRIGTIHQQFFLVPRLSVLDNVLSGMLPKLGFLRSMLKLFASADRKRACELLGKVELKESQLYQKAGKLSGGQQQRVAIARAFIRNPDLVLADEPVASLDPSTSRGILRLLRGAAHETGATVLCSLHQVDLAHEFADRIVAMRQGKLVFDGKPSELDEAMLAHIYDGTPTSSQSASTSKPRSHEEAVVSMPGLEVAPA